jgi:hypothetical protein
MKLAAAALSITFLVLSAPSAIGADGADPAAETAAVVWLALVDSANYAESWNKASSLFRQRLPQAQWQAAAANARAPFGALKSRKLQSATSTHSLPGAPDGEYVVITFTSSFEKKASAIETVTPMKDGDGTWRVSGYYIR